MRHLIIRLSKGEVLPNALGAALSAEAVTAGWLRASGVLSDIELRAFDAGLGALGAPRRLTGPIQVLTLDASVGLTNGSPSFSLRGLLVRETDRGLETLAGEIMSATTIGLEVFVTVLDDVVVERSFDPAAGVWLLDAPIAPPAAARGAADQPHEAPTAWAAALDASAAAEPEHGPTQARDRGLKAPAGAAVPQRPAKPAPDLDALTPEPGDAVEHFAFGGCEVLKSDGDRLHLRLHKDGRIREIALEMLRVARLEDLGGRRRFRLERRI
ncbi:MAG: DUF296 domain-containing protein [Polyangiaceae bacterium]|jgi:predicted DNA-binding protein with PD1-like motif